MYHGSHKKEPRWNARSCVVMIVLEGVGREKRASLRKLPAEDERQRLLARDVVMLE